MIWLTADNHFNHKNIIEYCKRPFRTVEEMDEVMIKKWNEKVKKEDLVIHLGDFCLGSKEKIKETRKRLNGTVILIPGNHDRKIMRDYGFIIVEGYIRIKNLILTHRPLPLEEIPKGFVNVHGHMHEKNSYRGINISVDKTNYVPVELNEILQEKLASLCLDKDSSQFLSK